MDRLALESPATGTLTGTGVGHIPQIGSVITSYRKANGHWSGALPIDWCCNHQPHES